MDATHKPIAGAFRQLGASVLDLSGTGGGAPDLLIGLAGRNVLLELKTGSRAKHHRRDEGHQRAWRDAWRGQVAVAGNLEEALLAVGAAIGRRLVGEGGPA